MLQPCCSKQKKHSVLISIIIQIVQQDANVSHDWWMSERWQKMKKKKNRDVEMIISKWDKFLNYIHSCPSVVCLQRLSEIVCSLAVVWGNVTIEVLEERRLNLLDVIWSLADCSFFQWIMKYAILDPPNYSTLICNKQIWFSERHRSKSFKIKTVKITLNELYSEWCVGEMLCTNDSMAAEEIVFLQSVQRGNLKPI